MIDRERRNRINAALLQAHLDAVICNSASEILLLTGYWPVMGASVGVASADDEIYIILPEDEVELAQQSSTATLVAYQPARLGQIGSPIEALVDPLHSLAMRLGLSRARIGVQTHQGVQPTSYLTSTEFRSSLIALICELLPEASFVECSDILDQIKATKTPKELKVMQIAANVAASAFARAGESIQAGKREAEVAAALQAAFQSSPRAESLQRSYGFFFCMSGPNSGTASAAYARTRQRRIQKGDLVMIHANTCADGYRTDITRTYTVGCPTIKQAEMRSAMTQAREAALDTIRPGVLAREVDAAARRVMIAKGFGDVFKHSTGHGVGFAAANGNALPRIHPQSPDVLDEGMTFNVEPAAYFDGYGGRRHCDMVAVTSSGVEVLTEF